MTHLAPGEAGEAGKRRKGMKNEVGGGEWVDGRSIDARKKRRTASSTERKKIRLKSIRGYWTVT